MADDRIVPTTRKGEEPAQAPPRRRLRAALAALAVIVAVAAVIVAGVLVNRPDAGDSAAATQQAIEQGQESQDGQGQQPGTNAAASQDGQKSGQGQQPGQQSSQNSPAASGQGADADQSDALPEGAIRVHITVTADPEAAAKLSSYPYVDTDVVLVDDQTPYGALIATGFEVGGSRTYVRSIGGLAEKALGGTSGWMYMVNGAQPMKPAGSLQLYDGDSVYWHFVDTW